MQNIFKSYDVRGIYPSEINEEIVERIGRAFVAYTGAHSVVVGRDNRVSTPALFAALLKGLTEAGTNVIDCGLLSTPMLYFASHALATDGAIMITASHNPGEYNGLKFCGRNASPIGLSSGLSEIRDLAHAGNFAVSDLPGKITTHDLSDEYSRSLASFANFHGRIFRVVTDTASAMGVRELPVYDLLPGVSVVQKLYGTLELPGVCPHEANPLVVETLRDLQFAVLREHADIGIAYDGDADRIGFVDEKGRAVPMDLITALLARALLASHPGGTVLYDLRSSRAVKEVIESAGGVAHECKVGHANIKKQMLSEGALMAGEASGHYYFALSGYTAEMGTLPAILLLNEMARTGKPLSFLVDDIRRYAHSGEINRKVADAPSIFARVRERYHDGKLSELDGLKIEFSDWWFSLRASNTEPLLRLNLEADTKEHMQEKLAEVLTFIY